MQEHWLKNDIGSFRQGDEKLF